MEFLKFYLISIGIIAHVLAIVLFAIHWVTNPKDTETNEIDFNYND